MKTAKQIVMPLAIALLMGINQEVEAQNWLTAGNNVTPGQYLGSQNNQPLNIRTANIQRAQFTTGNALNSWLGNAGDGLRIFDPAGGGGNLDSFTSSNAGGNETHVRFGGSGQVSGQNNRLEFISTGASMGNYTALFLAVEFIALIEVKLSMEDLVKIISGALEKIQVAWFSEDWMLQDALRLLVMKHSFD